MSNFKKLSAYADVPCTWVSEVIPDDDKVKRLKAENAKLRELVDLYEFGATHDQPPTESLVWNNEITKLRRELGIEMG